MTPSARVQSAIEILDLILASARGNGASADRIVAEWFKTRRFAGSGDRRAIRDLVWAAVRACGPVPESGRSAVLRLANDRMASGDAALAGLFDGAGHGPAPVRPGEAVAEGGVAPAWLVARLAESGIAGEAAAALLGRAPLDVRVNGLKADRATLALPVAGEALPAAQGLRLPAGTAVETWDAWLDGLIEVQDGGSQMVCGAVGARPGELVVDLCAGGGGKTLSLAADMANSGRLVACDVARDRLSRLAPRARRAGVAIVEERLMTPGQEAGALSDLMGPDLEGMADAVLVDAPCSGTGTWRRNPEGRWRLSEAELGKLVALQARLLDLAAPLVKVGGRLVFVTCSLLDAEGADQVAAFLARHGAKNGAGGWRAEPVALALGAPRGDGWRLDPLSSGTDGFFVARLERL